MNIKLAKLMIVLSLVSALLNACSMGGHGVDVTIGHNNCATVACGEQNTQTRIDIH